MDVNVHLLAGKSDTFVAFARILLSSGRYHCPACQWEDRRPVLCLAGMHEISTIRLRRSGFRWQNDSLL
jgi:hypothetical protein